MDDPDPQKYTQFLVGNHIETGFFEIRQQERLLGVAVVDQLPDGLSAVYTFYEPDEKARGLGVYAVLWEIEHARQLGLPYLYLGYWIEASPKMAYKADYSPLEIYRHGHWQQLAR
jgi:arginine-tRNA-protein transferase